LLYDRPRRWQHGPGRTERTEKNIGMVLRGQCNVDEWCADGLRIYDATPQQDPEGPVNGQQRALRGGSWIVGVRYARSACRLGLVPGYSIDSLGFRLCLNERG